MKIPGPFANWFRALTHNRRSTEIEGDLARVKTAIQQNLVGQLLTAEKIDKAACDLKRLTQDIYREIGR